MGRPAGSKNKVSQQGNPDFKITPEIEAEVNERMAQSAITDADLEFERELQMMNRDAAPSVSDQDPGVEVRKSIEPYTMLSEYLEGCKPAATPNELDKQIFQAKKLDCDSVECTSDLFKYYNRSGDIKGVGYFLYHNIKVYIAGFFEQSKKKDLESTEFRNFGASKVT